jgi:hypothetical protein
MHVGIWVKTGGGFRNILQITLQLPLRVVTGIMEAKMKDIITIVGHQTMDGFGEAGGAP